jgi:hypothetical protein
MTLIQENVMILSAPGDFQREKVIELLVRTDFEPLTDFRDEGVDEIVFTHNCKIVDMCCEGTNQLVVVELEV